MKLLFTLKGSAVMKKTNKWTYALGDEENYNGIFFDSKEDSLYEAMQEARLDDVLTVWAGQVEQFQPVLAITDELFYQLQEQAYEEADDYSIGCLDNVTKDDQDELDEAIKTCFIDWLNAHPEYKPNFFTVTDAECIKVQKER